MILALPIKRSNLTKHVIAICVMLFALVSVTNAQKFGDNLGNHIATKDLLMGNQLILNARGIVIGSTTLLNNSIALQIDGIGSQALLITRITDTFGITIPVNGMLVYSKSDNKFYFRQGGTWITFGTFNNGVTTLNGEIGDLTINGDNTSISVTKLGKSLTIAAQNTSAIWNANKLMGNVVAGTVPTSGQALVWNSVTSSWEPTAISQISFSGNGVKTDSIVTTLNGSLRKLASSNLIFVSDTASMLSNLLKVSDTANMLKNYVRKDNIPAAGVSTVSITSANGVSGSVLSSTTTPAITLTLGAITPTSVSASGAITGTTLGGTLTTGAQPNITSVGTLGNLNVSGVISAGTISGTVTNATTAGTVTNPAQNSITSLGTLAGLTVTAAINGSVTGNAATATKLAATKLIN